MKAAELEGSLSKIASLSKTLNEASDRLSKSIAEVESALNDYGLGIEVWLHEPFDNEEYTDDQGHLLHAVARLGYCKRKGKWGLLVASGIDEFWDPETVKDAFLTDSPRTIRLKAVDKIPELLRVLAERLAETTEEATMKAAQAKGIAAALRKTQR
jgi:hypothetical protein